MYDPSVRNFKISLAVAASIAAFGIIANMNGWTLNQDFNKASDVVAAPKTLSAAVMPEDAHTPSAP